MNNDRDTFGELRGKFDGQDPFMTGGHQIIKTRRIQRTIPDWAKSNRKLREILLLSFPYLKTNDNHRKRAARWVQFIQLYYRMNMTEGQVAAHTGTTVGIVKNLTLERSDPC